MLTTHDTEQKARLVVAGLGDITAREAIGVLQIAIAEVLDKAGTAELSEELTSDVARRQRGRPSKITRDAEVRAFIHTFTARDTMESIAKDCMRRFGPERAPSRSSICRYFQSLKVRQGARR